MNSDKEPRGFRVLPKPQKTAVISLTILAVAVVVLWFWQFHVRLTGPFSVPAGSEEDNTVAIDSSQLDSDNDGLSDYDEVNVYGTSPYLEDSDSDGLSDAQEIANGSDPNCPEGQNCQAASQIAAPATTTSAETSVTSDASAVSGDEEAALEAILSGQLDAASLRQLLIANGADQEALSQISDEDLMASYQQTLQNQANQSSQ